MTDFLIAVAVTSALAPLVWFQFVGLDRILRSGVRRRIQPDESVVFESYAFRISRSLPARIFSLRNGYLVVTNLRLIFAAWLFPPFRSTTIVDLNEIVVTAERIGFPATSQTELSIHGKKWIYSSHANRFWPFASKRQQSEFIAAIRRGAGDWA